MKLRDYQQVAIDKTRKFLQVKDKALLVAYTASGKSLMCAEFIYLASMKGKRVLILVHTKELVGQNCIQFQKLCSSRNKHIRYSICCSGLGLNNVDKDVVFASPQTFINRIDDCYNFDLIILDESHRVSTNKDTTYQKILSSYPKAKIIGMTATPYRDNNQLIYGDGGYFDGISHTISSNYLLDNGYLTPYMPHEIDDVETVNIDTDKIKIKANGSYDETSHSQIFTSYINETVKYAIHKTKNNRKIMIFCVSIEHAEKVQSLIHNSTLVHGKMSNVERDSNIQKFKVDDSIRYMVNVAILTTGFDYPRVDCIVLMRAVQSFNLYLQILGRAQRLSPEKKFFNVVDFGNNVTRFGGIFIDELPESNTRNKKPKDNNVEHEVGLATKKQCEKCLNENASTAVECFQCGTLLKSNLSYECTAESVTQECIKYTTFKHIYRRDKSDMCIITYNTDKNAVTVFLTFGDNKFKNKLDREFMLKFYHIKCSSLQELKRLQSNLDEHKLITYFKNQKGFYEVVKLS